MRIQKLSVGYFNRLAIIAALGLVSSARAGVVSLTRNSSLSIQGQVKTDDLTQSKSFTNFGVYNDSVTSSVGDPAATHANGTASQNTNIDISNPNKIVGSGSLSANAFGQFAADDTAGPLMVRATSHLDVMFQISGTSEPFTLHGNFDTLNLAGATSTFALQQTAGGGASPVLLSFGNTSSQTFGASQQLPAGTYMITADTGAGSSGSSPQDPLSSGEQNSFSFNFSVGHTVTAIPLPAAVWTGAVGLIFVSVLAAPRRRKRTGLLFR